MTLFISILLLFLAFGMEFVYYIFVQELRKYEKVVKNKIFGACSWTQPNIWKYILFLGKFFHLKIFFDWKIYSSDCERNLALRLFWWKTLYEDILCFPIFGSNIKNGLRDYYFLERNLEHLHKFMQKFMSIYYKNQLFLFYTITFQKLPLRIIYSIFYFT